ncbi:WXG100 family type VII secretion target [Nocardia vermiculata]|uniref:PPE family domain-containing protein n=1 Tax=Nocardia vermiculata TaxID=257274 RepID=A0A846XTQ0_9NOCA|nr:hypothetical protein [Nocardia vermiculata]NKY48915.1 hypothetical protein [Nocardia vermiculata]
MTEIPNEPSKINDHETSEGWEHWEIYNTFHPLDTTPAQEAKDLYNQLSIDFGRAADFFAARIRQSSSAAWQGPAAEASRQAVGDYAQRALDLSTALDSLHSSVARAVMDIADTKLNVPKPNSGVGWNIFNPEGWSLFNGSRSREAIDEAKDKARIAMTNHYVNPFAQANASIPVLPVPDSPTNPVNSWNPDQGPGVPGAIPPGGLQPGGISPGGDTPNGLETPGTPDAGEDTEQPGTPEEQGTSDSPQDPTATNPAAAQSPTAPTALDSTAPAGMGTTPSSMGSGTSGGPYSGGGTSAIPGGGLGSLPGGGPGKSVPGQPGTPGSLGSPAAAAAGKPGGAGMPGMGMGGMGGARGKQDSEENTHELPEWLRTMENAEELLGPDVPTIPGGVIGSNPEQAPPK